MTDIRLSHRTHEVGARAIAVPGRRITCALAGLDEERFLFGLEDGWILETGVSAPLAGSVPFQAATEQEPINGIAFTSPDERLYLGVTTRSELRVHRFREDGSRPRSFGYRHGGHGICSTVHNGFVLPMGPDGFITLTPGNEGRFEVEEFVSTSGKPYCYKISPLGHVGADGLEHFVAALRTDGVGLIGVPKRGKPRFLKNARIEAKVMDFVSVCSINDVDYPLAFVALGRDRTIHFFRDIRRSPDMRSLRLSVSGGSGYRILSAQGHLLVLTDQGLYILMNVVKDFLKGKPIGGFMSVRFVEIEASDFTVAHGKWVLFVTPKCAVRMALSELLNDERPQVPAEPIARRMSIQIPTAGSESGSSHESIWSDIHLESRLAEIEA
jgi:hypothetical protein